MPCKIYEASVAVSAAGDVVYVTAGGSLHDHVKNNVYCYKKTADHWTMLPQPGHRFGVLHMVDDRLTIFGGSDPAKRVYHNKVTTYNSSTNSWYSCYPDMLNKRFKPGVITYHDYVFVMGGKSNPHTICDSIEVMDYKHQLQWKEISVKLPVPMWAFKPTISGSYCAIVGYNDDTGSRSKEYYQITLHQLTSTLDQPLSANAMSTQWKKLSPASHYYTTIVPYSNPPMIIGGEVNDDQDAIRTSDISMHDKSTNSWRKVGSLKQARSDTGVALLNWNTIIVIGGTNDGIGDEASKESSLKTVEISKILPNYQ